MFSINNDFLIYSRAFNPSTRFPIFEHQLNTQFINPSMYQNNNTVFYEEGKQMRASQQQLIQNNQTLINNYVENNKFNLLVFAFSVSFGLGLFLGSSKNILL